MNFKAVALIGATFATWAAAQSLPAGTPSTEINPRNRKVIRWGLSAPAASTVQSNASTNQAPSRPKPAPLKPNKAVKSRAAAAESKLVFDNLVLRDEEGKIVYRGSIDVRPSLERIDAEKRLGFRNDGSVFGNREGRIPRRGPGYYREWVVPTPGHRGPGPMRIVTGENGEAFFTSDHYKSFHRIR